MMDQPENYDVVLFNCVSHAIKAKKFSGNRPAFKSFRCRGTSVRIAASACPSQEQGAVEAAFGDGSRSGNPPSAAPSWPVATFRVFPAPWKRYRNGHCRPRKLCRHSIFVHSYSRIAAAWGGSGFGISTAGMHQLHPSGQKNSGRPWLSLPKRTAEGFSTGCGGTPPRTVVPTGVAFLQARQQAPEIGPSESGDELPWRSG